jgi:NAD(P)H-nitrite reductase large subunit
VRVVIIGNGVSGMEAALALKKREPTVELTIVSEESDHFFSRTALMWVLSGQLSLRDIEPLERDAYARLGIRRLRARARAVDVAGKVVRLCGDLPELPYDRLLIACGSSPRPAPWQGGALRGVGHFVTLQDLEWLERELYGSVRERPPRADAHLALTSSDSPYRVRESAAEKRGRPATQPAVVGGGLIGIEAVEVMVAMGKRPRFFVREEWFWPIALDRRESRFITDRMRSHGVDVLLEHDIERFSADAAGNVEAIHTQAGRHDADVCVVAIGVVPNTGWLEGSDIERSADGGIVVDAALRTSAPGVYAAGDCAAVRWFDGRVRPEQLWYTARDQGRMVARSMLGDDVRYARGTLYNSAKLMDIEYTTVGLVNMRQPDEREWFFAETGRVSSTTRIVVQGERVIGFNLLGRRWDHSVLVRFIEERRSLPWVLAHLHQASFDTELVPKLIIPPAARSLAPQPSAGA